MWFKSTYFRSLEKANTMQKSQFEILRRNGRVFIDRSDLVAYLVDEIGYTTRNGSDSELGPEFVAGMVSALTSLAQNVGKIGK